MPYRANLGGAFGGGAGPATAHPIDIGSALDAITNAASTTIQNAYARQRAKAEIALNQQRADTEAQRYSEQNRINEQRYQDQNTRESARYESERKQKKLEAGLKALGEGVQLPSNYWDEFNANERPGGAQPAVSGPPIAQSYQQNVPGGNVDLAAPQAPAPATAPAIAQAYQGTAPQPAPAAQSAPVAPPTPVTVPTYNAATDPRITRAAAITEANERAKLKLAPLQASADSAKTVNTAKGMIPVAAARAAAEQAATAPGKTAQELAVAAAKQKLMLDAPPQVRAEAKAFTTQNKALADAVPAYAQAKNAFAEAKAGNPAALKSAILAFAGVADPKAQLRQGVIHMIEQIDPSVKGNFELAVNRLTSGRLPTQMIDNMEKLVDRTHATHQALYDQRRAAEVGRHPALDGYLPSSAEIFNVPGITGGTALPNAPPTSATHPIAQKYGITPSTP